MTKHTPTPWHYSTGPNDCAIFTDGKEERGETIATLYAHNRGGEMVNYDYETRNANAAFIVKAVNCHDDLIEALEWAYSYLGGLDADDSGNAVPFQKVKNALSKAKGAA